MAINSADYVESLLKQALARRASDVHVEQRDDKGTVRLRLDGYLQPYAELSREDAHAVIARIKFLSGIDFAVSDKLQEGRFSYTHDQRAVDMRVSVVPVPGGEDLVTRILTTGLVYQNIAAIGLMPEVAEQLRLAMNYDVGLVLVTGPTGSGKTTTLFACVQEVNDAHTKIITVEDPIEYKLNGLTQIKLKADKGLNYGAILKTVLRHDPDIIMVGETRDLAAAEMIVEATLTGHLVLTTLHTSTALGSIMRLINLGLPPADVANSLSAVYSQRLLRKLCPHCKVEKPIPDAVYKRLPAEIKLGKKAFVPQGCPQCDNTGFKGRLPLAEILLVNDALRDEILLRPTLASLNNILRQQHFKSLLHYGIELVQRGEAHLDEVVRVAR